MYPSVHCSAVYNSQDLEATLVSINRGMNKEDVVYMKKKKVKVAQLCLTLCDPSGLYSPWNSPGQNTEVGSLSLLQGIFPTQGWNPGLPHCRQPLYHLSQREAQGHGQPTVFIISYHLMQQAWAFMYFGIHGGSWNGYPRDTEGQYVTTVTCQ